MHCISVSVLDGDKEWIINWHAQCSAGKEGKDRHALLQLQVH